MSDNLPTPFSLRLGNDPGSAPDPLTQPRFYEGVLGRRVWAWVIDLAVYFALWLGILLAVMVVNLATLWLLSPIGLLLLGILPLMYHGLAVSGAGHGTIGMRVMGLEVRTMAGGHPDFLHAAIHWVLFHLSVGVTGGLILLFALFNTHRRTFHDYFTNLIVVRRL